MNKIELLTIIERVSPKGTFTEPYNQSYARGYEDCAIFCHQLDEPFNHQSISTWLYQSPRPPAELHFPDGPEQDLAVQIESAVDAAYFAGGMAEKKHAERVKGVEDALENVQAIRNVAGDIDIGTVEGSERIRGNIGRIVSRACTRLDSFIRQHATVSTAEASQ